MESPVRVLHVLQRMEAAGVQTFLMNAYRAIDRDLVQFDFLVHYEEDQFFDQEIRDLGGRIFKLSVREDYNLAKYKRDLRYFFDTHREFPILHGHMETLSGIWMHEAQKSGISTRIAHSHTAGFNESNKAKLFVKQLFRRDYPKYATDLFACSKSAGNFMFGNRDFVLYPNAIDCYKFAFSIEKRCLCRRELGIPDDALVLGHVGRFHPSKNHYFLLEILGYLLSKGQNAYLLMIGDGDLFDSVREQISLRGLQNNALTLGRREDVAALYSAMDIFVMPSLYEGLPLVGVEAQAAGLPCVFSTEITSEVGITELASFFDLDAGASAWATEMMNLKMNGDSRELYSNEVAMAGYDSNVLAKRLQNYYLSKAGLSDY